MNTSLGYSKRTLDNTKVLLSGGGDKLLSEFIGSISWDAESKELKYTPIGGNETSLVTLGSNALSSTAYLPLSGGTLSNSNFGAQLTIERSGSANMAAIRFKNSSGTLGYLATNTVNGAFVRYNAAASASYTILDSSNSSVSLSGSTLTVKINGTSESITDTNTWRGIQDNLTSSTNTTESLSAKQGYLLANGSARDNTKLPLAGGTMNDKAVISRSCTSANISWYQGRLYPIIKTTSYTGYNSILSMKTTNGSWDLGVYSSDTAYLTYIKDTDYNASNNSSTYQLTFPKKTGTLAITDDIAWANVSGKPSSYTPSSGSSYYLTRDAWWQVSDTHDANDLRSGVVFAYDATHHSHTAVTGTLVAFSCHTNENYTLQLQGSYAGNGLYFRNRNGDGNEWQGWRTIIHSGNIGSQSVNSATKDGDGNTISSTYLKLAGGTLTGALTINPSNTSSFQDGIILNDNGGGASEALTIKWTSASYTTGVKLSADLASNYLIFHDGTAWRTIYHSGNNPFVIRRELADAYINGTTYSTLDNGTYIHTYTGASETIIHFQRSNCSASGLDIRFKYPQDSSNPLQYRKCIDSNRFASTDWVTLIDSLNIGSQSVASATKASQDADGNTISSTYLKLAGGTMTGSIVPDTDKAIDLGSSTKRWRYIYSYGMWGKSGAELRLGGNDTTLMYLTSGARCGIGTDSPGAKLGVAGGADMWAGYFSGYGQSGVYLGNSGGNGMFINSKSTSSSVYLLSVNYGASSLGNIANSAMQILADGKVGIGTTSPSLKLHVSSGLLAVTCNSRTVTIGAQNSSCIHIYNDNNSTTFFNGGVSSSGNGSYDLGGTSYYWNVIYTNRIIAKATTDAAAGSANHVALITGDPAGQHLEFDGNEIMSKATGTTNGILYLNAEGGNVSINEQAGNCGIGNSTPSYKLHVSGNAAATNFYTTSDRNKKQNISLFSEHIRKFQLKDTEKWHYGVIAQEVPEMFRDGKEGNMTVNYNSVLSYYVGLLENKVASLEKELSILKQKLK